MIDLDVHHAPIRLGDTAAFARWLAGAEPALRLSLRRFAADVDVEVVLQEALVRAWQFADRVLPDGRPNALLRYTLRVARNLAIDSLRRSGRRPEVDLDEAPELAAPVVAPPDPRLRTAIEDCVDALPPQPQAALRARLTCDGGRADRDLAEALEMSLNTFLKNVGRARVMVKDCLDGKGVSIALEVA